MVIKPKVRGFVCITAHPQGCAAHVQEQIDHVKARGPLKNGPKNVLVIGASTGYGLASRIASAFGSAANTLGVFYERPSEEGRPATPGWYNTIAFTHAAHKAGLKALNINGDAFSDEIKRQTLDMIKRELGPIDLVVYSLASPRRTHPKTGLVHKSVLKPVGQSYTNKTVDTDKGIVSDITIEPANETEIADTAAVMGGEDWEIWIEALEKEGLLAPNAITVAYSYVGPAVTQPVYRSGTIGAAKDHLEATAKKMDARLQKKGGRAFVSVNKALVTQSSSAIPFIPLYFTILMKVMKAKGLHEDCIHQMIRLFAECLYTGKPVPVDSEGRIRVDDLEMRDDVQSEVASIWEKVTSENVKDIADVEGYHAGFLKLFGFGVANVDYNADVKI